MTKAVLIHEDGKVENVVYDDYKDLQKFVGGHIEGIHVGDGFAYIDEEGKLKGKFFNRIATQIWHDAAKKDNLKIQDFIVGKMVLTGSIDKRGKDTNIKKKTINDLKKYGVVFV